MFDDVELAKTCKICGKPIPLERLKAVPNAERCISCQEKDDKGIVDKEKPIYCKRCGARMVWRLRTSVRPAKYFLGCSNYPKCTFVISGPW